MLIVVPYFVFMVQIKNNMGQNAPHYQPASSAGKLEKLPPPIEKVETIEILKQKHS